MITFADVAALFQGQRVEAPIDQFGSGLTIETGQRAPTGGLRRWGTGRDLRETAHVGEAALSFAWACVLGVLTAALATGCFLLAAMITDTEALSTSAWRPVILGSVGIVGGLVVLVTLLAPFGGITHWFTSRRMIQGQQLDYLRRIADRETSAPPTSPQ